MAEQLTKEENQELADNILKPIITKIDEAVVSYDVDRLRATYKAMQDKQLTLSAFPFPETQDKSDSVKATNNIFESILDMIELRIKQREVAIEQANKTTGADIVAQLMGY